MISTVSKIAFVLTSLIATVVLNPTVLSQNQGVSDQAFFKALNTRGANRADTPISVFDPPQDREAKDNLYKRLIAEAEDPSLKRAYEVMRQMSTRGDTKLDLSNLGLIVFPRVSSNVTELNLDGNRINELPPWIGEFAKLEKLSVRNNQLTQLPPEIGQLTRLNTLDLRGNDLTTAPPALWGIRTLQVLRIETSAYRTNPISNVAFPVNELGKLTDLTELHVVGFFKDHITTSDGAVPRDLGNLTKLKKLILRNNSLSSLPSEIGNLVNLEVLDFSENHLDKLPNEIGKLKDLVSLDVGGNYHCDIPPNIFAQLKKLERLDFADCRIEKIPDDLLELPRLTELHVSKVEIGSQSDVLWKLTNLTKLSIGFLSDDGQLPTGIGRLVNLEELSLAGSALRVIPNEIGQLARLRSLDLSGNSYQFFLPSSVAKLTRLKVLNLQGCEQAKFPAIITKLEGLEALNLVDNSFAVLPSEFWNLTALKSLRMGTTEGDPGTFGIRFEAPLSPRIANFKNLVELDVEGMFLPSEAVPQRNVLSALGTLTKLEKLNLSHTELSSLTWIGKLTSLKELDCSYTSLQVIPSEIRNLKHLQIADFSFCGALTRMSVDIGQLKNLLILDITGCAAIESLPAQIGRLSSLQELRFDFTKYRRRDSKDIRPFKSLPNEIGQLQNLEVLLLGEHHLSSLPREIGELKRLKKLKLTNNRLTSLPDSIGKLSNLRQIDLSGNQLVSLPSTIGGLVELLDLPLQNNRLKTLPPEIGRLTNLNNLGLNGNQIESLPDEIGQLKLLRELNLSGQRLTVLPETIGSLKSLTYLNLSSNRLNSLPLSIRKLKQLKRLGIGGNQLKDLPAEFEELTSLVVLDVAGNELNRSTLEALTSIDRLKELWLTNDMLWFSYMSDAHIGKSKAEKKAERKEKLAKYFGGQSVIAGEADNVQLELPPFPEGTAPSEKATRYLNKYGDMDKAELVERYIGKDGKPALRTVMFYKLPDNRVSWDHLEFMDGFVIAFNQFIPLPKFDGDIREITFYTDEKRQQNAFKFGMERVTDKQPNHERFAIWLKDHTQNTKYLLKNFAYKFKGGYGLPTGGFSTMRYLGTDDNPIRNVSSYWKLGTVNSADYARDMTRTNYMDPDSRPLFSYFAPKGKTAWEAMMEAEEKMEERKIRRYK